MRPEEKEKETPTDRYPSSQKEAFTTSQKQLIIMDAGSRSKWHVVPQHRPIQNAVFIPTHEFSDKASQSRMFYKLAILRV